MWDPLPLARVLKQETEESQFVVDTAPRLHEGPVTVLSFKTLWNNLFIKRINPFISYTTRIREPPRRSVPVNLPGQLFPVYPTYVGPRCPFCRDDSSPDRQFSLTLVSFGSPYPRIPLQNDVNGECVLVCPRSKQRRMKDSPRGTVKFTDTPNTLEDLI